MARKVSMHPDHHEKAHQFRLASGTVAIEETLQKAVRVLHGAAIPHFVIGGYAVQEHGYRRYTKNIDLVVPDVIRAFTLLCENGFQPSSHPGSCVDPDTGFEVRFYGGGKP